MSRRWETEKVVFGPLIPMNQTRRLTLERFCCLLFRGGRGRALLAASSFFFEPASLDFGARNHRCLPVAVSVRWSSWRETVKVVKEMVDVHRVLLLLVAVPGTVLRPGAADRDLAEGCDCCVGRSV